MNYQALLEEIRHEARPHFGKGSVASYIPALGRVSPDKFGMAITLVTGETFTVGDADERFSIQSTSKLFSLMLAMNIRGDEVWIRVGKEPSGTPFNSLVQLEYEHGVPRNPFINAGALVVLDCIFPFIRQLKRTVLDHVRVLVQNFSVDADRRAARSERKIGFRNVALANLLKSHGTIESRLDPLLDAYFHQCAIGMTCTDLSRAVLPLANKSFSTSLQESVLTESQTERINSLMLTCGMYNSVGSFAYRVGLPGKSGVGGGIVAVMPGEFSVAVWSPELDRSSNSRVGTAALQLLTQITHKSIF